MSYRLLMDNVFEMGIFDFFNNKKKENARQEQLRLQQEYKRRVEEQRRLAEQRKQEEQQKREESFCLISSLILPVISVMKTISL